MIQWDREQRKLAKDKGYWLLAFGIDGGPVNAGRFEQTGPVPEKLAKELLKYVTKRWNEWEAKEIAKDNIDASGS